MDQLVRTASDNAMDGLLTWAQTPPRRPALRKAFGTSDATLFSQPQPPP